MSLLQNWWTISEQDLCEALRMPIFGHKPVI